MDLSGLGHSFDSSGGGTSAGNDEAISYRIKWCRENIAQLKRQTWPMEKKLQVLRASKLFIKQHQGELKQSKQAGSMLANSRSLLDRYWRHFRRELANFLVIITPWEMRIKKIESHFGSVVASYFTFLRWIFWLNLANSLVLVAFVLVPELIENVPDPTGMRKGELGMERPLGPDGRPAPRPEFNPTLGETWEFEGFLKFSPIFYGYYSNREISRTGFWRNPLAFLLSALLTYIFCFVCISRKLSQNTKLSRIGTKDDEYTFCWTVFVGWDFMIGNSETAYNKTSSLVMNLKEGILEEKEQTKDRNWRLIMRRVLANLLTVMLLVASACVVTLAVQRSENLPEDASLLQKNELQLVMSGIQFMFPPLFDVIGIIEKYHPRKALSWQLGRILFLDFLNFYTLMFSLFGTVGQMGNQLAEVSGNITLLRANKTYWNNLFTTTTTTTTTTSTTTTTALPATSTLVVGGSPQESSTTQITFTSPQVTEPTSAAPASTPTMESSGATRPEVGGASSSATSAATIMDSGAPADANKSRNQFATTTTTTSTGQPPPPPPETTSVLGPASGNPGTFTSSQPPSSASGEREEEADYPDLAAAAVEAPVEGGGARLARAVEGRAIELDADTSGAPRERAPEYRPASVNDPYRGLAGAAWTVGRFREPVGPKGATAAEGAAEEGEVVEEVEPLEGRLLVPARRRPLGAAATSTTLGPLWVTVTPGGAQVSPGGADQLPAGDTGNPSATPAAPTPAPVWNPASAPAPPPPPPEASVETISAPPPMHTNCPAAPNESAATTTSSSTNTMSSTPTSASAAGNQSTAPAAGANELQAGGGGTRLAPHKDCLEIPQFRSEELLALNQTLKDKLKSLCWETMFGQEMVKIVVMDLVMTVISAVSFEFMRACFVRYCNRFFFWDLERGFPGYQDFKIAENVLHLVNNQSSVWMGMFFAPGLPAINTVKLAVLMYVRSWAVLTCNIPHETVFKVSKSNNFYYWILLINLLICILPVAYAITWIRPSWHCGPFGGECRMYLVVGKLLKQALPPEANTVFSYLSSPGAVIPMLISLILIIYYLASTLGSSKEANRELKAQLKKDKEQEAAVPEITTGQPAGSAGGAGGSGPALVAQPEVSGNSEAAAAAVPPEAPAPPPPGSATAKALRPSSLLAPPALA